MSSIWYTHAMMNGQKYFVGEKLTINLYDDYHRAEIFLFFKLNYRMSLGIDHLVAYMR